MGIAAPVAALVLGAGPLAAAAAAGAGAALAAAVRALAGETPAALAAAVIAPLLAVATIAAHGASATAAYLALAGIGWTAAELARPSAPRPAVALAPAALAALLAPAAAALLAITGVHLARGPGRPRWTLAAPLAGGAVVAAALAAGLAPGSGLGELWFGAAAHPIAPGALAGRAADALGPLAALAALGGIAALARPRPRPARGRFPELAILACAAGALLSDLRAGAASPLTLGLGALAAGLGAARFAGQIRPASGQAITAAAVGLLLLLPPTWTAIALPSRAWKSCAATGTCPPGTARPARPARPSRSATSTASTPATAP